MGLDATDENEHDQLSRAIVKPWVNGWWDKSPIGNTGDVKLRDEESEGEYSLHPTGRVSPSPCTAGPLGGATSHVREQAWSNGTISSSASRGTRTGTSGIG